MKRLFTTILLLAAVTPLAADERWEEMDYGPFLGAAVEAHPEGNITNKGIVIPLAGDDEEGFAVLFDTDLLRYSAAWVGNLLEMRGVVFDGSHGTFPEIGGEQVWGTRPGPGVRGPEASWKDPRSVPYGPLPDEWGKWRGLRLSGDDIVLSYELRGVPVLDSPSFLEHEGLRIFVRTLHVGPSEEPLTVRIAEERGSVGSEHLIQLVEVPEGTPDARVIGRLDPKFRDSAIAPTFVAGVSTAAQRRPRFVPIDDGLALEIPPDSKPRDLRVLMLAEPGPELVHDLDEFIAACRLPWKATLATASERPSVRRWDSLLETEAVIGVGSDSDYLEWKVLPRWRALPNPDGRSVHLFARTDGATAGDQATAAKVYAVSWQPPPPTDDRVVPTGELMGHWPFDEGSGAVAADHSAKNRAIHVEKPSWRRGMRGRCLEFEGRTVARISAPQELDFRDRDFSISAWVDTRDDGTILAKTAQEGPWVPDGKTFFIRDGRLCFDVGWVGVVASKSRVADGTWRHIAMTYRADDGEVRLFVDGEEEARERLKPKKRVEGHVVRLGFTAENFPGTSWFHGKLDELRIYQRRLGAGEVRSLAGVDDRGDAEAWAITTGADDVEWRIEDGKLELRSTTGGPVLIEALKWRGRLADPAAAVGYLEERLREPRSSYVVDRISWPVENPWKSWMRFGGFDFYDEPSNAAICTWSGDVWRVAGIDSPKPSWQRIATGLHQPLGLRIVDDAVYVLGRDQITRLHDDNGDGETDYYEAFNDDCQNSAHFHEFAMDLRSDERGFFYMKGARHGLDGLHPHHGTLLHVTPDGKTTSIIATGMRAPNGLAIGDGNRFYTTDQEGHWMPANRLNVLTQGGFYGNCWGYFPDGKPTEYLPPLCWIHPKIDRSPSAPVVVRSPLWGMPRGTLLCLSYGFGLVFRVLQEEIDGVVQGGITPLPIELPTGIHRGRFSPLDGHLYLCGLFGWSSDATEPGGFYRIRYTGEPYPMPERLLVRGDGIHIGFNVPLDVAVAGNPDNYTVESWDYRWSKRYGSPQLRRDGREGKDRRPVTRVDVTPDGRSVRLVIADIEPVMQMHIDLRLKTRSGQSLNTYIHHTINKVPKR